MDTGRDRQGGWGYWPWVAVSPLMFAFRPRRVADAFRVAPLWHVYVAHLAGYIPAGFSFWVVEQLVALASARNAGSPGLLPTEKMVVWDFLLVFLCGEGIFIAVALMMSCWAGRREALRESVLHTLRMSWLFIGHFGVLTLGVGLVVAGLLLGDTMVVYRKVESGLIACCMTLISGMVIWSMASYLYAVSMSRVIATWDHAEPLCEWCGYELVHLEGIERCPECGQDIGLSLESSLRRPLNRKEAKWWYLQAWTAPESVFRGLAVSEGSREANWAFVWMCAIAGFTGVFGFISGFVVGGERPPLSLFIFWAIVMTLGSFVGWLFFMGGSGLASLFGYWGYRSRGRNRLVAAFHVVALTSGVYPIASFLLLFLLSGFMVSRARPFEVTLMFVGVAILVGIYVSALWHRMRYVLYSNK